MAYLKKRNFIGAETAIWWGVVLVLLFFFLAVSSLVDDSPTMDEQNHIARGLAFLRTGDARFSLEHPPLVNGLSALPVALLMPEVTLPLDHASWTHPQGWYEFAHLLLWEYNPEQVGQMVFLARLPIVFVGLGLALVGFRFARRLWGVPAGLTTLTLLLFDPNLLAHTRYSTTDVGGTAFLFLAAYLLWRLWQRPGLGRWLWASVGLGLAFGSKLSTLGFVPIFALLAVLPLYGARWGVRPAGKRLIHFGLAGLASVLVVWALYGFQWGPFRFGTEPFSAWNHLSGPMPTFWAGIAQVLDISGGGRSAYLLGDVSTAGFPAYFPVAFLSKTPLPALILFVASLGLLVPRGQTSDRKQTSQVFKTWLVSTSPQRALFLLLPAGLYFFLATRSSLNLGYRHLLPMLPFLYTLASGLTTLLLSTTHSALRTSLLRGAWCAVVGGVVLASLVIHPHYLSYFNLPAGTASNGHTILLDSNLDWGQDLLRLEAWMADNDIDQINLAWFGSADPAAYGINYTPLPSFPRHLNLWWDVPFDTQQPAPGRYAISQSLLWWEPPLEQPTIYPYFRNLQPVDRIGYSILIFEIE